MLAHSSRLDCNAGDHTRHLTSYPYTHPHTHFFPLSFQSTTSLLFTSHLTRYTHNSTPYDRSRSLHRLLRFLVVSPKKIRKKKHSWSTASYHKKVFFLPFLKPPCGFISFFFFQPLFLLFSIQPQIKLE